MPFIYKYVNKKSKCVEYVGIINKDTNFPRRFDQHKRDPWWEFDKYEIFYAPVESQTDAEALEGHFISVYRSYEFYNRKKSEWGECSFAPDISWTKYEDDIRLSVKKGNGPLNQRWEMALRRYSDLRSDVERFENEVEQIHKLLFDIQEDEQRYRRASIRQWFRSTLEIAFTYMSEKSKYATSEMLYESYCMYAENCIENGDEELYEFDNIAEFWQTMKEMPEYGPHIRGDNMYGLMTKEDFTIEIGKQVNKLWE